MISPTRSSTGDTHIVSLDVGTSSARALLFDSQARQLTEFGTQLTYQIATSPDGGVEVNADELLKLSVDCLTHLHGQMKDAGLRADAVAFSAFWHSFLGVAEEGKPTTPIIHLFDTRSVEAAKALATKIDPERTHARTGCVFHTSYWPAKLLWLYEHRAEDCARTRSWMSFGEYLFLKVFGAPVLSTSMASGSGLWNQNANTYDDELLRVLPIQRSQLAPEDGLDEPASKMLPEFRSMWPLFDGIPWYPALGDGACSNVGSGCIERDQFALMVGTSGAMRVILEQPKVDIPADLWCYRVDRKRFVLGGALSNGGEVFAWMKRTLVLPEAAALESELKGMAPGSHGLLLLPFFAGERSPYWRPDIRAVISGMSLSTTPVEILRAALESVAVRFRQIYTMMTVAFGAPREVVASGGALLHSPTWTQMMADALGHPVITCIEHEASSRGAAMLALERLGAIGNIKDLPAQTADIFPPIPEHAKAYARQLLKQQELYNRLFEKEQS